MVVKKKKKKKKVKRKSKLRFPGFHSYFPVQKEKIFCTWKKSNSNLILIFFFPNGERRKLKLIKGRGRKKTIIRIVRVEGRRRTGQPRRNG